MVVMDYKQMNGNTVTITMTAI